MKGYLQKILEEETSPGKKSSRAAKLCYALHLNDPQLELESLIYLVEKPVYFFK
jgi:hypothetical protein